MKTAHKYSSTIALVKELVVLLLIVFLIRTFVFGLYQVPTGSMERTMLVGERFFANKLPSFINPIRQGDIISFNDPTYIYSKNPWIRLFQQYVAGPINWTKRAIAVGPAVVRGVIEEGHPVIYVNDVRLEEPYVNAYPLIGIWPDNKEEKYEQAKKEAAALVLQGALDVSMLNAYINQLLYQYVLWRSYDPAIEYEKQPFYYIDPQCIVTTSLDIMDQVEVKDGVILKMPGVPVRHRFPLRTIKRGKSWWNGTDEFYVELDENEVWAMGDNRRGSWDSRFPDVGPIKKDQIHGKIVYRIWSIDSQSGWWIVDFLSNPIRFFKKIRWSRCLNKLV